MLIGNFLQFRTHQRNFVAEYVPAQFETNRLQIVEVLGLEAYTKRKVERQRKENVVATSPPSPTSLKAQRILKPRCETDAAEFCSLTALFN